MILNAAASEESTQRELYDMVYRDLRALAGASFRGQPGGHTLQPTALANEAYLRLMRRTGREWNDRSHFFALCGVIMRGILADHARKRRAAKRGGDRERVTLGGIAAAAGDAIDLIALDDALQALGEVSDRQARVVEYRFFGGLTMEEVAELNGTSLRSTERLWQKARLWLNRELSES